MHSRLYNCFHWTNIPILHKESQIYFYCYYYLVIHIFFLYYLLFSSLPRGKLKFYKKNSFCKNNAPSGSIQRKLTCGPLRFLMLHKSVNGSRQRQSFERSGHGSTHALCRDAADNDSRALGVTTVSVAIIRWTSLDYRHCRCHPNSA